MGDAQTCSSSSSVFPLFSSPRKKVVSTVRGSKWRGLVLVWEVGSAFAQIQLRVRFVVSQVQSEGGMKRF